MPPDGPPPRQVGDYDLHELVATGRKGALYRAVRRATGEVVAVRLFPATGDTLTWRRQVRAARAVGRAAHPHLVNLLDHRSLPPTPFLVTEYVAGESLGRRVERAGPPAEAEAVRLIAQVGAALAHLHAHGLVHRNVKPDNVLVAADGAAKLSGLGLVKPPAGPHLTPLAGGLGTPPFMAPEQFRAARQADPRCDVYGLAATLYAALTGRPPFARVSLLDCWHKKMADDFPPPRAVDRRISERTDRAVVRALRADPAARPATCGEFLAELAADLWFAVYPGDDGRPRTTAGSAADLRRRVAVGHLGRPAGVLVSTAKAGPFRPLADVPEFRDLAPDRPPTRIPVPGSGRVDPADVSSEFELRPDTDDSFALPSVGDARNGIRLDRPADGGLPLGVPHPPPAATPAPAPPADRDDDPFEVDFALGPGGPDPRPAVPTGGDGDSEFELHLEDEGDETAGPDEPPPAARPDPGPAAVAGGLPVDISETDFSAPALAVGEPPPAAPPNAPARVQVDMGPPVWVAPAGGTAFREPDVGPGRVTAGFPPVGSVGPVPEVAPAPAVVLEVFEHRVAGAPGRLRFVLNTADPRLADLAGPDGDLGTCDPPADLGAWVADLLGELGRSPAGAADALAAVGAALYDRLLPPAAQRACGALRERGVSHLLVVSDEPHVPWGLVRPHRAGAAERGGFWADEFALGQWLRGRPPAAGLSLGRVVGLAAGGPPVADRRASTASTAELPAVVEELELLRNLSAVGAAVDCRPARRDHLADALRDGGFDVLHVACQGAAAAADGPAVLLADGPFRAADLSPAGAGERPPGGPLVFLNVSGGRPGFALTHPGAWAERLIGGGAGAFVGPLWAVTDRAAVAFARSFYHHLWAGAPIGEAVRRARLAVRDALPGDPAWLAYCCFADPTARIGGSGHGERPA